MESMLMIVLMFGVIYFMMIRPEKKRKQQAEDMRNNLKKNNKITTIGGIMGTIVAVNAESIVIETGDDRVRIELAKWAVGNDHTQEAASAANGKKAPKKAKEEKKEIPESKTADELTKEIEG